MSRIVWKREDGGISITHVVCGNTEAEAVRLKENGSIPPSWQIVCTNPESLPEGRDFRDAWRAVGGDVVVDLNVAREMTAERLRKEREPLFEKLDADYMKALEAGSDTTAIVAEKKRLRDLPAASGECNDVQSLRNLKAG